MNFKLFALGAFVFSATALPYTITVHNNSGKNALVRVEYGGCEADIIIVGINDTKELGTGWCCSNKITVYYGDQVSCSGTSLNNVGLSQVANYFDYGVYKNVLPCNIGGVNVGKVFEDTYSHTCTGRTITLKQNSVEVK